MKSNVMRKLYCLVALVFLIGCGNSSVGSNPPDQSIVNADIQGITDYVLLLASDIDNRSCVLFDTSALTFPGVFPCGGGGSTTIIIKEQNCEEGPPLQGRFLLDVTLNNCTGSDGSVAMGGFLIDFKIDGEIGKAQVTSSDFEEDGIAYTLDISGMVDSQGDVTCSGTATADGFLCDITQDCNSCLF